MGSGTPIPPILLLAATINGLFLVISVLLTLRWNAQKEQERAETEDRKERERVEREDQREKERAEREDRRERERADRSAQERFDDLRRIECVSLIQVADLLVNSNPTTEEARRLHLDLNRADDNLQLFGPESLARASFDFAAVVRKWRRVTEDPKIWPQPLSTQVREQPFIERPRRLSDMTSVLVDALHSEHARPL